MQVGFIGLGAMGSAMAGNIAAAGHDVRGWNRSGRAVECVTLVGSPAEVFEAEAVVTMLSDDDAIRTVILEPDLLARAHPGLVHVVCSTISVAFAHELVAAHRRAGMGYVSAPVLGRPDAAARRELHVLAAGASEAVERVSPILDAFGQRVWRLGDEPPAANAAKVACNMMLTMAIEAMAEGVVITEANGVSRQDFFDVILGTLFGARAYQVYSANIADENYEPGFRATLGLKDLRLAKAAASEARHTLPMLDAVHGRMREAVKSGLGDRDWSIMAKFTLDHG